MRYLFFALGLFALCGCAEQTEELSLDFGYDYFPLEVGKFRIYQVDSVIFDPQLRSVNIDSTATQVRELVTSSFVDNTGNEAFRIERSIRKTPNDPWRITKVLVQSLDESRAFQVEDNLRRIKMVFPLNKGKVWNAHVFFDSTDIIISVAGETIDLYKDWSWEVLEVGESIRLGDLELDEVATIQLSDSENLIELRKAVEQYATGIGLIYREMEILDTQCAICCGNDFATCSEMPWSEKAEKGFIFRQRLIAFN